MTNLNPSLIREKMATTTGPENDFWYDRWYDLQAEVDDQNNAQLEAMNGKHE